MDRDGVITKEKGHITRCEQVELYPSAPKAVAALNKNGWLCVVVTNQSAVARGLLTEEELKAIHNYLQEQLRLQDASLDAIHYCSHLPPDEGERERPPYRVRCTCRKPGTGMLEKAFALFGIDAAQSYVIGDRETDIVLGAKAGLSTVLLRTGCGVQGYQGWSGLEPDYVFDDLAEAAEFLLRSREDFKPLTRSIVAKYLQSSEKRLVVLVGGQSRCGKSTLVNYLAREIKKESIPAATIRLDDWILPLVERGAANTVLDRYPASTIERDLKALFAGEALRIEAYEAKSRGVKRKSKVVTCGDQGVVFVEGVVALAIEFLRSVAGLAIFMDVSKETHLKRFTRHYLDKGLTENDIYSLYHQRTRDEYPIVEESRRHASVLLSGD